MVESTVESSIEVVADLTKKEQIRVLHVDDEPGFLKVAQQCLEMQGAFQVDTALSVDEALKKMKKQTFDVIVSDYQMPGKDGLEFLKELRNSGDKSPFIMFTGRGREEVAVKALNLGADQYLNKTGDPETVYGELAHSIRQTVKRRRAEKMLRESEQRFRNLYESIQDPVGIFVGREGLLVNYNKAFKKLCGYTDEELKNKIFLEFIHPDDQAVVLEKYRTKYSEEDLPLVYEIRGVNKKGEAIPLEISVSTYKKGDRVIGILVIHRDITERKKVEERLMESEERFRNLYKSVPDALAVYVGRKGYLIEYNEAFNEWSGYSDEELKDKIFLDFVHPDDQAMVVKKYRTRYPEEELPLIYEIRGVNKKEEVIPTEISVGTYKKKGRVIGINVMHRDITERKKAEERIRESEQRLRAILASSPDNVTVTDLHGNVLECNQATLDMGGFSSKDEVIGKNALEFIAKKDHKRAMAHLKKILEQGSIKNIQYTGLTKDGHEFPSEFSVSVIKDSSGNPIGFVAITRDITERKKVEEELKKSEERYRALLEETPVGICNLDIKGNITYVNRKFEDVTGFSRREVLGKNAFSLTRELLSMSEENRKLVIKRLKSKLMGRSVGPMRFPLRHKDGSLRWLEGEAKLFKRFGVPVGLQAIMRDITELVNADRSLKEAMGKLKTLNEKLGVVGKLTRHDVRNKLTTVANNVYMAKQRLTGDHETLEHLSEVESAVEQVEKIFEFARIYEKIGLEELAYMNVEKTLEETVRLFSDLHNVEVVNDCRGLTVLADSLLRQLIYNLIDNSLKYGEKVTEVRVYFEEGGKDQLKLVFEDDGVGIPKTEKEKIFKEGYGKGTGYGLYVIRKMCEIYGWTIRETGKQGKGAQFTITIPKMSESGKIAFRLH